MPCRGLKIGVCRLPGALRKRLSGSFCTSDSRMCALSVTRRFRCTRAEEPQWAAEYLDRFVSCPFMRTKSKEALCIAFDSPASHLDQERCVKAVLKCLHGEGALGDEVSPEAFPFREAPDLMLAEQTSLFLTKVPLEVLQGLGLKARKAALSEAVRRKRAESACHPSASCAGIEASSREPSGSSLSSLLTFAAALLQSCWTWALLAAADPGTRDVLRTQEGVGHSKACTGSVVEDETTVAVMVMFLTSLLNSPPIQKDLRQLLWGAVRREHLQLLVRADELVGCWSCGERGDFKRTGYSCRSSAQSIEPTRSTPSPNDALSELESIDWHAVLQDWLSFPSYTFHWESAVGCGGEALIELVLPPSHPDHFSFFSSAAPSHALMRSMGRPAYLAATSSTNQERYDPSHVGSDDAQGTCQCRAPVWNLLQSMARLRMVTASLLSLELLLREVRWSSQQLESLAAREVSLETTERREKIEPWSSSEAQRQLLHTVHHFHRHYASASTRFTSVETLNRVGRLAGSRQHVQRFYRKVTFADAPPGDMHPSVESLYGRVVELWKAASERRHGRKL